MGSFWEDLRNSGARKQGAAGARPVGGAGVPLPAALGQGSPTLQSVRLLALLLQLRVLWSKAAIAALQAVQLLSLLLQHKRRERFQQGGSHLAADSSTKAQASQAATARSCHAAAVSSTSAQAWVAVARLYRSPTRVPLVPFKMGVACVHRAGGHRGEDGCLVPPAMQFRRRSPDEGHLEDDGRPGWRLTGSHRC